VDCKTFQELITPAIDQRLGDDEQAAFQDHRSGCSPCRSEYDGMAATRAAVKAHVPRAESPEHLARHIVDRIRLEGLPSDRQGWPALFARPLFKPAIGFALACAAVLILLKDSSSDSSLSQASLASNDVVLQSLTNYRAVLAGQIRPLIMASEPARMESLFSDITDYSVHLPRMKDCKLIGGVQNEFAGMKLAHLVYQHQSDIVYMYQTCLASVLKGDKLHLSQQAKNELTQTGWFTETEPDGRTVVLWTKGRTLCAAVSRMKKDDLVAVVTSGEGRW
jgi:anti-sigma factor RsiW